MGVHDALIELTSSDFGKCIVHNRAERREAKNSNIENYEKIVIKGASEIEQLIQKNIKKVLTDCGGTL